jgi:hypothetical protein
MTTNEQIKKKIVITTTWKKNTFFLLKKQKYNSIPSQLIWKEKLGAKGQKNNLI